MLRLTLTIGLLIAPVAASAQGLAIGFDPDPFHSCATPAEVAAAQGAVEERPVTTHRAVRLGERTVKLTPAELRPDPASGGGVSQR